MAIGSIAELRELSGNPDCGDDLHRESVDQITIKSPKTGATLRHVDVLLCNQREAVAMARVGTGARTPSWAELDLAVRKLHDAVTPPPRARLTPARRTRPAHWASPASDASR